MILRTERPKRWPLFWGLLSGALVIACMSLATAYIASSHANHVAECVNENLGTRSAPSQSDAAAHIDFARAVSGLFLPKDTTPEERVAAAARFQRRVQSYVDTLVANQKARDAHPLGRC